jgi:hypothetical protein
MGTGTPHTPQLSSGWELWSDHANRDKGTPLLGADGEFHAFDDLLRDDETRRAELDPAVWEQKYARAQGDAETPGDYLAASSPDVVVIVGDDQKETFGEREARLRKFPCLAAAEWARHGSLRTGKERVEVAEVGGAVKAAILAAALDSGSLRGARDRYGYHQLQRREP